MYRQLLRHYYKEQARNPMWANSIWIKVLVILLMVYFGLNLLVLGIFYPEIVEEVSPASDPLRLLNSFVIFYLLIDLGIRLFFQEFPELKIQHYLLLPIKRSVLYRFLLVRSALSFFSVYPLFIIIPAYIRLAIPDWGPWMGSLWLVGILMLIPANTFIAFYLKRQFGRKTIIPIIVIASAVLLGVLSIYDWLPLDDLSEVMFYHIGTYAFPFLVPLLYLALSTALIYRNLSKTAYFESPDDVPDAKTGSSFTFLKKYGMIGELIRMDLRLILRNKRPRIQVIMMSLFLLYGFFFYSQEAYQNTFMYIFWGIYFTGIIGIGYAQLLLSWESSYFELLSLRNFNMEFYFKGKYIFYALTSIITFLITLPYAFFDAEIAIVNLACLLLNLGITFPLLIYFSSYNSKPVDLGKGAFFNTEGSNVKQFLIVLPILLGPLLLFAPFYIFGWEYIGFGVLAGIGILGILLSPYVIREAARFNAKRKYKLIESYRNR